MIDYQGLSYEEQRALDQLAYRDYYESQWYDDSEGEDYADFLWNRKEKTTLTFNKWYGSDLHNKHLRKYLRKYKLEKIKKAVQ